MPCRATEGKRKSFLDSGKTSGFRRFTEMQNLARQGGVCTVHQERLDGLPLVLLEIREHQPWTRSGGEAESKRTKLAG